MNALALFPELTFRPGQHVMESMLNAQGTIEKCESEIITRDGRTVTTETGQSYDALTGAAEPRGNVYRGIRSLTTDDRRAPPPPEEPAAKKRQPG